jgi:plasmid stabilization system protein ParE
MQLLITPMAARDLEEIGDYIAQANLMRAGSFWPNCERSAKKFVSTLRAIGSGLSCPITCDRARTATT